MSWIKGSSTVMLQIMLVSASQEAKNKFAILLKNWRKLNHKTQQEVSDLFGCSFGMVSKWETAVLFPRVLHFKKVIKEVTGIDVDEIAIEFQDQ